MVTYIIEANKETRNFYYTEFIDKSGSHTNESIKKMYDDATDFDCVVKIKDGRN